MYSQERLKAAFELVEDKTNWKNPIDAIVSEDCDFKLICSAVIHFTGSFPSFMFDPKTNNVRVKADGYYAAVGA